MKLLNGVTLIELLLYIGLLSFILTATVGFYSLILQLRTKSFAVTEVQSEGSNIIEQINIITDGYVDIITPEPGNNADHIVFINNNGDTERIEFNNNNLIFIDVNNESRILHSNSIEIISIIFRNLSVEDSKDSISYEFIVSKNSSSLRNEFNFQEVFRSIIY